jgi:hypothetical protein
MSDTVASKPRSYRFGPLDRSGWLLGLSGAQCVLVGGALLAGAVALRLGLPLSAAVGSVVVCGALAFVRWRGRAAHGWLAVLVSFGVLRLTHRDRWGARLPLFGTEVGERAPDLPGFLAGLGIVEVMAPVSVGAARRAGVGVVIDDQTRRVTGLLRVRGREFGLLEPTEQERLLDLWGDALAGFCRERGQVARVAWSEWAAPAGLDEHTRYLGQHLGAPSESPPVQAYVELLDSAGPLTTRHDVLVAVTVDPRRAAARPTTRRDRDGVAIDALLDELGLLSSRLDHAGLIVDAPLSATEIATALRVRCDPSVHSRLSTRARSAAELAGLVGVHNAGPLAVSVEFDHVRVDGSVHRAYWVAEWPRLEVPTDWLGPMLLHAGSVRTLTVVYEPVPPSRSQRRLDREATRLASDEEQRRRGGFRVGARLRRAQHEVLEREAELVAGYAELGYVGFVTVTAPDLESLERACAEYEQIGAQAGLELRRLDGQHDVGLGASLPVGRHPSPGRLL